jgi:predicted RNA-binding protein with RPS1 domain
LATTYKFRNYNGIIENNESWDQLTLEQHYAIILQRVLVKIECSGVKNSAVKALANLYRNLPIDITLDEIDSDWYQERRAALNKEFGLGKLLSQEEKEFRRTLKLNRLKTLKVGQVIDGTVFTIKSYGLFVDIGGCNALLHISLISQMPIEQLDPLFKEHDWIRAMIVDLDIERGRISLSTSDLEVEPGDMLKQPWKVYETAQAMADRYYQNVLSRIIEEP